MSDFMINYITRFKVRFEKEIDHLVEQPLAQPSLQESQLMRARRVVDAANAIIAMGPNAVQIDIEKFENYRSILLSNNVSYNRTQRQLRNGSLGKVLRVIRPAKPMRSR
ncbi:hypothetical protein CAEBREN_11950 [Caenorhabditis brenneri]|uniref:Uncharacterized protein n=1 Tax=Caenorhabditis brenneri TaxID=135651 RepID=G0MYA9_CAEBE|nr:hypothetical protein CAEBREN_11950 [Caenorhabditis brenneri]